MAPAAYPLAHRQRAGDLESPPFSLQLFAGHLHSRRDLAARFFCVPQGGEFGVADHDAISGGGCHEDNSFSIPVVCELLEGDSCPARFAMKVIGFARTVGVSSIRASSIRARRRGDTCRGSRCAFIIPSRASMCAL
jgi:hypothetical protein